MPTAYLTLYQLNSMVQDVVEQTMNDTYWVEAELADVNERRGHLFAELIQKDEASNTPVARASAKCWASTWNVVRRRFESVVGTSLKSGMKVMMRVYPQFHPAYGFSWIVADIDPTYTMGDMARRRQEIIRQLKDEGVFDLQRELHLPLFCQRIAVISSETAAGFGDFCNQLENNDYGFHFCVQLFPAVMQGEQVEASVIAALDRVYSSHLELTQQSPQAGWDAVVIIRGGGATSDMSGFDTLLLAENVANFPLPIITGIGHERDECVLDMVAFKRVKTPTAAAAYLIEHLAGVQGCMDGMSDRIVRCVTQRLETERVRLTGLSARMPVLFSLVKTRQMAVLENMERRIVTALERKKERELHRLDMMAQRLTSLDPQLMLKRGYSITLSGGKIVTDASKLMDGEVIETRLANGKVLSVVHKENEEETK